MDAECSAADIIAEDFACKKCKNSKIAVYEDPNITCETIVNDNCNMIVYDGATYTDCLSCKTGYYRTLISDDDL
ncbi:MAG: hypothetical protein DHS20C13_26180 [Thermodesulfobacteriota bacterium]|nr:MAG: hypothetical protein DHS20C13_26180 [Thermodesulfobacteriota bacterium]